MQPVKKTFEDFVEEYVKVKPSKDYLTLELKSMLDVCFEKFPTLRMVCWFGHTPTFNDGDPCVHRQSTLLLFDDCILDEDLILFDFANSNFDLDDFEEDKDIGLLEFKEYIWENQGILLGESLIPQKDIEGIEDLIFKNFMGETDSKDEYNLLFDLLSNQKLVEQLYQTNYSVIATRDGIKHEFRYPAY